MKFASEEILRVLLEQRARLRPAHPLAQGSFSPASPPGWHANYNSCVWRSRATEEQKKVGWEMWVRMEKILCTVLHEAHERQIEETMDVLSEGLESFYRSYLD